MNSPDYLFNKFSLNLLFLLIFFTSFHELIIKYFYFYKEAISLIFLILSIRYFFYFKLKFFDIIFKNKIYIFFFPYILLILIFCFNIGPVDIEFPKSSAFLTNDTNKFVLLLYVIRNLIVLMPVVFFFSLRGINENEQRKILSFFFLAGFLGFITHLIYQVYSKEYLLYNYFLYYNFYAFNNTYMPYISSLYFVGLYLGLKEKNNFCFFFFIILSSIFLFMILLSSAKASILFCIIVLIYYSIIYLKNKKKLFFIFIIKIVVLLFLHFSINIYAYFVKKNLNENNLPSLTLPINEKKDVSKFNDFVYPIFNEDINRLDLTSRIETYNDFVNILKKTTPRFFEFYFGSGSLISTFSGFHNDYMRVFYRAGIFGLLLSFAPFFYFFFNFTKFVINRRFFYNKNMHTDSVYVLLVLIGFNLYYSLFAYPRDDFYQSITIWIALILMYGYLNKKFNVKKI